MKKLMHIMLAILMSVSCYSQDWFLKKTIHQNKNAVLISESVMDSISLAIMDYNICKKQSFKNQFELKAEQLKNSILLEKVNTLEGLVETEQQKNALLQEKIKVSTRILESEKTLLKQKKSGKLLWFGTGVSIGVIGALLMVTL
ncbi:hypothetical protein ACE939_00840 [Aquimarina sp. W85]|uniref:hypothetical protein n=1 Tax=Aquimarina rhodophyticola TaxID=3342246 RepID=UPI0036735ADD